MSVKPVAPTQKSYYNYGISKKRIFKKNCSLWVTGTQTCIVLEKLRVFSAKTGGTYNDHCALKS